MSVAVYMHVILGLVFVSTALRVACKGAGTPHVITKVGRQHQCLGEVLSQVAVHVTEIILQVLFLVSFYQASSKI